MRIAIMSDTLGFLPDISGAYDIFIHCGNFCPRVAGDNASITAQASWLERKFKPWISKLDAEFKIIVPGYTDLSVQKYEGNLDYHIDAIYLRDESATVRGMIVHGTPWLPYSYKNSLSKIPRQSYVARTKGLYRTALSKVPEETDILITRIPPFGILDEDKNGRNIGDKLLLKKIKSLTHLTMHFFGYAKSSGGKYEVHEDVLFANASLQSNKGPGYLEVIV